MSDGTDFRADFESDLFGLEGDDPLGVSVTILRATYEDDNGNWIPEASVNTRILRVASQPANPYVLAMIGLDNNRNANPNTAYIPYSAGEPRESDVALYSGWRWSFSNVNSIEIGDDVVCYVAEMIRTDRIGAQ